MSSGPLLLSSPVFCSSRGKRSYCFKYIYWGTAVRWREQHCQVSYSRKSFHGKGVVFHRGRSEGTYGCGWTILDFHSEWHFHNTKRMYHGNSFIGIRYWYLWWSDTATSVSVWGRIYTVDCTVTSHTGDVDGWCVCLALVSLCISTLAGCTDDFFYVSQTPLQDFLIQIVLKDKIEKSEV